MEKLKKFIPILIGITAIADTHFELLKSVGFSESEINLIKLIGLVLTLFLPEVQKIFKSELPEKRQNFANDNTDPQNPKVPNKKI